MARFACTAWCVGCVLVNVPAVADPPANDLCRNAFVVNAAGPHIFDNREATESDEHQELCCESDVCSNGLDVWFRWTATCAGPVRFLTCESGVDTKIAVYRAPCPPSDDSIISCNNDNCGLQSLVQFNAVIGQTYLLCVGTFADRPGGFGRFEIECGACPCDFNGDGSLDELDFYAFIECFFNPGCPGADINNDGLRDTQDLFDYLRCFFDPPDSCSGG